ncbi:hypothetical protein ACHQM5_001009 [Ranunculus cassubicifolius]
MKNRGVSPRPHWLSSTLSDTGTFSLMPKMLALIAVQRHTATSMSARPLRRLQQGVLEEVPITTMV